MEREQDILDKISDKFVDGIDKIFNYILSKIVKADIEVGKVSEIDEEKIKVLKERYKIEGIILDVDETLRKDMADIPKCNKEWIEKLKQNFKIIVVSNGIDKNVEEFLNKKDITYIGFAFKPLKKNFIKACEKMNIKPENVLVIGDSLYEDIYGGKRNKMKTAIVKEVDEEER